MLLFVHKSTLLGVCLRIWYSLNLIDQYSVLVNDWTQNEVIGLLLDQLVSIGGDLVVANGGSDAEDCLPCIGPSQTGIQFISKF